MSREILFKNNEYGNSIWYNKKAHTISVIIYDKDDKPIKSLKVDSRDYIILPSGATVELAS